jgi:hypothetical protein
MVIVLDCAATPSPGHVRVVMIMVLVVARALAH